ncbi:MAG: type II toxin-antitoxin system ParD family antitoxin [Hoeflea sp.]|uniref:type II toxin-antitoxin system ParD family antitoxin n=1 Tax=Hoeflea sp. TaxID=1940281 RepID=UPI001DF42D5F|nr:type II toxin-antitoxin system ParD family antitoxin [Hoeflea sp.]MBU4529827.1 type II toxin-antitoxin system ParD family antitoxin [Alphaproteobacteria bacterium]MBU4547152.1 type II toxin-antitoxin system ParD family antitoxin [Alphaproteobacteria bacterium]MBU4548765.1 type II toxin-antitoxin system ParD family antitoxin [Alphaproteobacteria bacterium]MBV1722320.1 type II toxin-antitoxin system ParD family antitoxin [Hoeflea sp.]MBV1762523.1 type II toxin-antitoxin system ParD family ant
METGLTHLGDHYETFVGTQVGSGKYGSTSEVIRAGLRLLEEREIALNTLQAALIDGEKSGISARSPDEIIAAVIAKRRRNGTL